MAGTDLEDDQKSRTGNPAQDHFDREFANIAQNFDQTAEEPGTTGRGRQRSTNTVSGAEARAAKNDRTGAGQPRRQFSARNLGDAESAGSGLAPTLAKSASDGDAGNKTLSFGDKTKNFLHKHKKAFIGLSIGGGVAFPLILLLLFIIGSLQLQDFTLNMIGYEFAKVARENARSTQQVVGEKLAMDSEEDGGGKIAEKFRGLQDNVKTRFYAIPGVQTVSDYRNSYSLGRVSKNLRGSAIPNYEELPAGKKTVTRNRRIVSYSYPTADGKLTTVKVKPGFNPFKLSKSLSNQTQYYRELYTALNSTLDLNTVRVPTVVRSGAMIRTMGLFRATWGALSAKSFENKTKAEADAEFKKQMAERVADTTVPEGLTSSEAQSAAEDAKNAQNESASSTDNIKKDIPNVDGQVDSEGISTKTVDALNKAYSTSKLTTIVKGFSKLSNPIYNIAVPVCIAVDSSTVSSSNSQSKQAADVRQATTYLSLGAAQRAGGSATSSAVLRSASAQLGGATMNSSSVMREAANENVDTLGPENPSESPAGTYQTVTIFDALFHNTPLIASALNFGAKACPTISNIYFGIGVGILNLTGEAILGLFTGGAEPAAEEGAVAAAEGAAEIATDTIISRIVSQFTTRVGLRDTYDFLKKIGVDTVKQGGLIAAASFLAKWTVKDYAASVTGMASGAPLREQLGAGTNALTQTYMQQNMGGAAQTNASLAQSDSADRKYRVDYERSQSFTTRYFALTNPQSLLTHVGMDMASSLNHNIFGRSLASLTQLFRPTVLFSSVMGAISPGAIAADDPATAAGKAHYGNVQFGWTVDEQKTIDSSSSYYPLENDKILDNSGKKDEIISKYGKCFTEPAAQLLEDGDIERTGPYSTDIKPNAGLCSPQQLGPHNPDYGDLVFRYRLSMNYDTTMRIQLGIQNAAGDKDASDE